MVLFSKSFLDRFWINFGRVFGGFGRPRGVNKGGNKRSINEFEEKGDLGAARGVFRDGFGVVLGDSGEGFGRLGDAFGKVGGVSGRHLGCILDVS